MWNHTSRSCARHRSVTISNVGSEGLPTNTYVGARPTSAHASSTWSNQEPMIHSRRRTGQPTTSSPLTATLRHDANPHLVGGHPEGDGEAGKTAQTRLDEPGLDLQDVGGAEPRRHRQGPGGHVALGAQEADRRADAEGLVGPIPDSEHY